VKWLAYIAAGWLLAVLAYPILLGLTMVALLGWWAWESAT
jgi:hypothetical protein